MSIANDFKTDPPPYGDSCYRDDCDCPECQAEPAPAIANRIQAEIAATGIPPVTDEQIAATVAVVKARLAS